MYILLVLPLSLGAVLGRLRGDQAFVCDTPPVCWLSYLSCHCDPSHFSCLAIKRTRTQPEIACDIQAGCGWSNIVVWLGKGQRVFK